MNKIATEARELYSLLTSEFSYIPDLIYASVILSEKSPSLSSLAEAIAVSELTHFRLLSHIVRAQGIEPRINLRIKNNTGSLDSLSFCEFFRRIAKEKREMSEKYSRLSQSDIFCPECSRTLRSIADDERSHCEMILCETDKIKNVLTGNNKI